MFFTMPCPTCGKPLKGRDELVGKTARCPYCRSSVTVRRPEEAAEPEASPEAFDFTAKPGPTSASSAPKTARPDAATSKRPAGQPKAAKARSAPPPASAAAFAATPDTNVSGLLAFLGAIAGTAAFYALLWPIATIGGKQTYLGRLFIGTSSLAEGGWVPIVEVFLFFWAGGMLLQKWFKIRRQQRGLLYDVLPTELGETIRAAFSSPAASAAWSTSGSARAPPTRPPCSPARATSTPATSIRATRCFTSSSGRSRSSASWGR